MSLKKTIFWTILVSEMAHILCCVLPTVISLISLFTAFGLLGFIPGFILDFHDFMHDWELLIISFSIFTLVLGWLLYAISLKMNCNDNSRCEHGSCKPKKDITNKILLIATFLFTINISIYFFVHSEDEVPHLHEHVSEAHNH